ncbi:MAG: hypothetical protein H6R27_233 [Proteobacteria bacterium]|nr:hypothetical protein [Pseudomonadota bacterium]
MSNRLRPVVGLWYNHLDKGDLFQVVALDEQSGTIEIQEFDGDLDEIDLEEWRQMNIEAAAPPEDWTGPVDELEPDDRGYSDTSFEERGTEQLEAVTSWEEIVGEEEDLETEPPSRRPALRPPRPARHHH